MSNLKKLKNKLLKKFFQKKRKKTILEHITNMSLLFFSSIVISGIISGMETGVVPSGSIILIPFLTVMLLQKLINYFKYRNIKKSEDGFEHLMVFSGLEGRINRSVNCPAELALEVREDMSKSTETTADMMEIINSVKRELSDDDLSVLLSNEYLMAEVDKNNGSLDKSLYLLKLLDLAIVKVAEKRELEEVKNKDTYKFVKNIFDGIGENFNDELNAEVKKEMSSMKVKKEKEVVE